MKKLKFLIILFFIISIGYYFLNKIFGFIIPCLFHELTNLYCPGCGITRMMFSIISFNFYQAFRYNPLVFILLVISIIYAIIWYICLKKYHKLIKLNNFTVYSLLFITIIYGIMRNIEVFEILKPTIV